MKGRLPGGRPKARDEKHMRGKKASLALASLILQAALTGATGADVADAKSAPRPDARADSTLRSDALRGSGRGSAAIAVSILKKLAARKGRKRAQDIREPARLLRALNTHAASTTGARKKSQ